MTKELMIASIGMSLFIICPRMAGMVHVISKNSSVSLYATAVYGTIIAISLVLLMVLVFTKTDPCQPLICCVCEQNLKPHGLT